MSIVKQDRFLRRSGKTGSNSQQAKAEEKEESGLELLIAVTSNTPFDSNSICHETEINTLSVCSDPLSGTVSAFFD